MKWVMKAAERCCEESEKFVNEKKEREERDGSEGIGQEE